MRALLMTMGIALVPGAALADEAAVSGGVSNGEGELGRVGGSIELAGAVPLDERNSDRYGLGGGITGYVELNLSPLLGVHLGVTAMGFGADQSPESTSWVSGAAGVRLHWSRLYAPASATSDGWLDLHGSFGRSGGINRSGADVGLGYELGLTDSLRVGPAARLYWASDPMDDAAMWTSLGISGSIGRRVKPIERIVVAEVVPPPAPEPEPVPEPVDSDGDGVFDPDDECPELAAGAFADPTRPGCPRPDSDGDGILDEDDKCPDEPEVVNGVEDTDGCPDEGVIELVNDRIVLEERVLFELNRARVRSGAQPIVEAIVELVRQHPEWKRIRIEGHADRRGPEDFNVELSGKRARNVMRALIEAGLDENKLEFEGFGSSKLLDEGTTEDAHRRNRRVEFVVVEREQR